MKYFYIYMTGEFEMCAGWEDYNANVLSRLCVFWIDETWARNSLQCCTWKKRFFQSTNLQLSVPSKRLHARYFMAYTQEACKKPCGDYYLDTNIISATDLGDPDEVKKPHTEFFDS